MSVMYAAMSTQGFAHPARNVAAFGVEPGMKVADFGSGSGAYVLAMAARMEGAGVVYAVDIQKDLLRRTVHDAKRQGLSIVEVVWGDIDKPHGTSIGDKHLDMVLISNLLFQLEFPAHAFAEARRVLKPGGRLVVIDWAESFGGLGPEKKRVVPREKVEMLAREAGFETVREFDAGEHHYGYIFIVPAGGFAGRAQST